MPSFIEFKDSSDEEMVKRELRHGANPNGAIKIGLEAGQLPDFIVHRTVLPSPEVGLFVGIFEPSLDEEEQLEFPQTSSKPYPQGVEFFSSGRISLGKTAELCGKYFDEIVEEIVSRGLPFHFGPSSLEEAEEEVQIIRRHIRRS